MAGRSPDSVEMRVPAIASAMTHVAFLAAAVLNLDFFSKPPLMEPEPVMVEFEAIDKKAAAPTVGNPPPQPKDVPIAQETTKAPPPKSAEPPPSPPTPKPPEVVEPPKPPAPPKPEEKPKTEAAKPVEDLVAMKPKEPEPPKVEKPPEPPKPAPANLAAVVTASEIEGVRQKIRPCWNTQGGARDQAMVITLVVEMSQNGTPVKADLREPGRYNSDPAYRAAADAAHRAIMNPRCQPWPLSPEKFNSWKTITFNFDPRDY
ncbi:MAG: hypothetical protein EBY18_03110 [Alphaproteobacteria bacterium]|nr:hypothetical protein [Alphaproteobacteria bacterium]